MNNSDPLDGKIREALADVVSRAPIAPEFDDIEAGPGSPRGRTSRPIAWAVAAAAVAAVVLVGAALAGTGDTTVDTGMDPQAPERDGAAATSCEERASQFAAEETDLLVFMEPGSSRDRHDEVARAIGDFPDVDVVRFVDQQATYDEFRELFADSPDIVESVTAEILPPRFELRIIDPSGPSAVTDALARNPAVREVVDADRARAQMRDQCGDDAGQTPTTTIPDGCQISLSDLGADLEPGPSDPPTMPGSAPPQDPTVAHRQADGQRVEVHVPGIVVRDLVGEQVEDIELPAGEAQLWLTDDFVQVRRFPGGQDACDSFTVTAAGGSEQANRDLAIAVASGVRPSPGDPRSEDTEAAPDVHVLVRNGSGRCGIAGDVADAVRRQAFAEEHGLRILPPANGQRVERTIVYATPAAVRPAERIAALLGPETAVEELTTGMPETLLPSWDAPDPSIVVVLGSDQASAWPGC